MTDQPPEPEPNFEDALEQLEAIVDDLERGEPELSTALAKYERGVRLLNRCHQWLEGAERSVALLSGVDEAGNPVTAPFDATATAEREPAPKRAPKRSARRGAPNPDPDSAPTPPDDLAPF